MALGSLKLGGAAGAESYMEMVAPADCGAVVSGGAC